MKWFFTLSAIISLLTSHGQQGFNLIYPHGYNEEWGAHVYIDEEENVHLIGNPIDLELGSSYLIDYQLDDDGNEVSSQVLDSSNFAIQLGRCETSHRFEDGTLIVAGREGTGRIRSFSDAGELNWEFDTGLLNTIYSFVKKENGEVIAFADEDLEFGFQVYRLDASGQLVSLEEIVPYDEGYILPIRAELLGNNDVLISGVLDYTDPDTYNDGNNFCCRINGDDQIVWTQEWGNEWEEAVSFAIAEESANLVYVSTIRPDSALMVDWAPYGGLGIQKLDITSGAMLDLYEFGPDSLATYWITDFVRTSDDGFALMGTSFVFEAWTSYQFTFLCKLDLDLNMEWFQTYGFEPFETDPSIFTDMMDLEQHPDGGFVMCGYHHDFDDLEEPNRVPWVLRTDECGNIQEDCITSVSEELQGEHSIFPNPGNGLLTINTPYKLDRVIVYDYAGREVMNFETVTAGQIFLKEQPVGVYLIRTFGERNETSLFKFVLK